MRRMLILLLLFALLGGCGGSDGTLTDAITGAGQTGVYSNTVEFRDDGSYDVVEKNTARELEWGTWSTEDEVLTMVPAEDAPFCPVGSLAATRSRSSRTATCSIPASRTTPAPAGGRTSGAN
jgi:hypothetical protein